MRYIGPEGLDAAVGLRAGLDIHVGGGAYHRAVGKIAEAASGDLTEFYLQVRPKYQHKFGTRIPIRHGDRVTLQNNGRGEHHLRTYHFVDASN